MKFWILGLRYDAHGMQAVERYKRVLGPLEHNVTIGGVEFVFVDAQALDGKVRLLYPYPPAFPNILVSIL